MKRLTNKKILIALCLTLVVWIAMGQAVSAQGGPITSFLGFGNFTDWINGVVANLVNVVLSVLGWFLTLTGVLLNISINLTTHLDIFIKNTPVIYTVWDIIRDISSMLLIFFILLAAIQMILGLKLPGFGTLLKNIVIMGILINFSFFITSVMIDASNIVSLQFYNAIAPNSVSPSSMTSVKDMVNASLESYKTGGGGISDIFMGSLRINQWWENRGQLTSLNGGTDSDSGRSAISRIILVGFAGSIVIIITILSFLAASAAALWRVAVLIFLLGFSPIWIASRAIPQLDDAAKPWWNQMKANLLFLPAYLMFMYVAVLIVSKSGLNQFTGSVTAAAGGMGEYGGLADFINLFVGFAIVIFLLNIPLIAAIQISGAKIGLVDKLSGSIGKFTKWSTVGRLQAGGRLVGSTYENMVSRGASAVSRSEGLKDWASRSWIGQQTFKGIRGTAAKYDKKLEGQVKARTEFAESLGYDQAAVGRWESRLRNVKQQLSQLADTPENAAEIAELKRDKDDTERIISEQKTRRKKEYSERIDKRSTDTLWTKVARKDKKAAAKIQTDIIETKLKEHKDDLKDIKGDIKQLQSAIRNNPPMEGRAPGVATPAQQEELNRLTTKQNTMQQDIDNVERGLALEKLKASS